MFFVCFRLFDIVLCPECSNAYPYSVTGGQTMTTTSAGAAFDPELASLKLSLNTFYRRALLSSYYYVINVKSSQDPYNELPFFSNLLLLDSLEEKLLSALHRELCLAQSDGRLLRGPAFVPRFRHSGRSHFQRAGGNHSDRLSCGYQI